MDRAAMKDGATLADGPVFKSRSSSLAFAGSHAVYGHKLTGFPLL